MEQASEELRARLREPAPAPAAISDWLDSLDHPGRVAAIRSLGRAEQRALYAAVDGFRPVTLDDLVPREVAAGATVRHHGRNTLPAFNDFEKRFCRPDEPVDGDRDALVGFNFQTMQPLTGPGYFIAVPAPERPEVWVDYNRVPDRAPDAWPAVRRNDRGLSRFIYGHMVDTLRRVSEHVTVGSAARKGRDMGSWFVLCRDDV